MYSRQELCQAIMDECGPELVPNFCYQSTDNTSKYDDDGDEDEDKGSMVAVDSKSSGEGSGSWSVDLEEFDMELVVVILPPDLRSKMVH